MLFTLVLGSVRACDGKKGGKTMGKRRQSITPASHPDTLNERRKLPPPKVWIVTCAGHPVHRASANILVHRLVAYMRTRSLWHVLHGNRRPEERCERPDRPVATRARGLGRTGRSDGSPADLTPGSAHCTGKPRGSGWDSGRTKLPNPRAPPTPSDADRGGGWERVRRD